MRSSFRLLLLMSTLIITPIIAPAQHYSYRYTDGNNNTYAIYTFQVVYEPVQPRQSSSGIYSGGKPKIRGIREGEYNTLKNLLHKGIEARDEQTDDRPMGSGTILINEPEGTEDRNYVLRPDSPAKARIEKYLRKLME